jgi:hypothetical protein
LESIVSFVEKVLILKIYEKNNLDFATYGYNSSKGGSITWTQFMRGEGGARIEAGESKEIVKVKGNQFK